MNSEQAMISAEKKRTNRILMFLVPVTLIMIILAIVVGIYSNKAGGKKPISSKEFMESAYQLGCAVDSIKEQLGRPDLFKSASAAQIDETNVVHYLEFKNKMNAKSYFATVAREFKKETEKIADSDAQQKEFENYCFYNSVANGKYFHVVRVQNTVIWANVDEVHKQTVRKIISAIGY